MGTMTSKAYKKMIQEDIEELCKHMPDTLERKHIIDVLKDSINKYYPNK